MTKESTSFNLSGSLATFYERGWDIVPAQNKQALDELRNDIFKKAKSLVSTQYDTPEDFFNNFHELKLGSVELNKFRLEMIDYCTKSLNVNKRLLTVYRDMIMGLVGPDVASQKIANLVIQCPGDHDVSPVHRDAPLCSHFEVVVWLPFVDCYGTKGMYVSDKVNTSKGLAMMQNGSSYQEFSDFTHKHSQDINIKYGDAVFFAAGIAHGVPVNVEKETRWSMNIRFKNIFSPYGSKGILENFEIIHLSSLSRVGFEFQRQEYGSK